MLEETKDAVIVLDLNQQNQFGKYRRQRALPKEQWTQ